MQRKGETAFFFCTAVSERNRMNSFMSWVGGKKALRDAIVARLCCSCDRYVEVFGGGAWVLFHKLPGKFEVYNDFNPNLANLYNMVINQIVILIVGGNFYSCLFLLQPVTQKI